MPRFFFNVVGHPSSPDCDGTELASANAARLEGIAFAGAYLRDHPEMIWDGREIRVEVSEEDRRPLLTVILLAIDTAGTMQRP